jgi:multisubunit Na+/H+ antiporter MnhG subunit
MGLDIRLPIGAFFSLIGVVLGAYGLFSDPVIYQRSLGINVNLEWGVALVVFGLLMMFAGMRKAAKK